MRAASIFTPAPWLAIALGVPALTAIHCDRATAAPSWQTASLSSPKQRAGEVAVAIDSGGEAVAVWVLHLEGGAVVQSSSRPPHGTWSAPVQVSGVGEDVARPKVAMGDGGEAVAVWVLEDSPGGLLHSVVQSASRPAGGAWSSPVTLSRESDDPARPRRGAHPEVAVNGAGEAVAVWESEPFSGPATVDGAARPAAGAWSAPVSISSGERNATRPKVAIDAAGEAVAVWQHLDRRDRASIQAAALPAGGTWSAPAKLSRGRDPRPDNPEIAIDAAGRAVAVWEGSGGVRSAARSPAGRWSAPTRVSAGSTPPRAFPRLAVDSTGAAVVVWNGGGGELMRASGQAGRHWRRPKRIVERPGELVLDPGVGIDASGRALVVWGRLTFGPDGAEIATIVAASGPSGGNWPPPTPIARVPHGSEAFFSGKGVDGFADLAVNAGGEAVAVWERLPRGEEGPVLVEAAARP